VFLRLIQQTCPLCSRLSSRLRDILLRCFGRGLDCRAINQRTNTSRERVAEIDAAAPDCACENHRMSKHSPGVVADPEQLAMFVFNPMQQVNKKTGLIKPNVFSHVNNRGRSIQREDIASDQEMIAFVRAFLAGGDNRVWKGVLVGKCHEVRSIEADTPDKQRAVCVYDTANPGNISHGELCKTRHISEADGPELRHKLFEAFGKGVIYPPNQYRNGSVWGGLASDLQARG
jgi:hypothetical protein